MLLGGGVKQIDHTIRNMNMVGNVASMICGGAKASCAMKAAAAVGASVQSAMLAMDGRGVTRNEGIVKDDIEQCIAKLASLRCDGMGQADRVVWTSC
jgi:L-cysteine desulfidase